MKIIKELNEQDLETYIQEGKEIVKYHYCYSFLIFSIKYTDICILEKNENRKKIGMKYAIKTLLMGPWGFPWGPIFTFACIITDLSGGEVITNLIIDPKNKTRSQLIIDYIGKTLIFIILLAVIIGALISFGIIKT